jgi:hypothetical protein
LLLLQELQLLLLFLQDVLCNVFCLLEQQLAVLLLS